MSRTTRTPSPEAAQPADAPGDIALPALKDLPAVAALLSLVTAMLAVARFPSSPMPVALTDRLSAAQQEFAAALEGPAFASLTGMVDFSQEQTGGYDDAWIREQFEAFNTALKDRFTGVDEGLRTATDTLTALSGAVDKISERLGNLDALTERVSAIEAAAAPTDKKA